MFWLSLLSRYLFFSGLECTISISLMKYWLDCENIKTLPSNASLPWCERRFLEYLDFFCVLLHLWAAYLLLSRSAFPGSLNARKFLSCQWEARWVCCWKWGLLCDAHTLCPQELHSFRRCAGMRCVLCREGLGGGLRGIFSWKVQSEDVAQLGCWHILTGLCKWWCQAIQGLRVAEVTATPARWK